MNVSHAPSILVAPSGPDLTVPAIAALKQTASLVDTALAQTGEMTAFQDALQYAKYAETLLTGDQHAGNDTLLPMLRSTIVPGLERLSVPGQISGAELVTEADIVKSAATNVADSLSLYITAQR